MKSDPTPITIERHPVNGSYHVSAMLNGSFVIQAYYGYTKREALKLFKEYLKVKDSEITREKL